jgi:2-polyprenyl-3-methyl-5-hydroxy-6-metoxy-1,4-benzoquinol methylase
LSSPPLRIEYSEGRYRELIEAEARHWERSDFDPVNPQLWDDPVLYEITLGAVYRHLVERASRHARVLELGCGDGDLSLEIAMHGASVTGLDVSEVRVSRAGAEATARGLGARATFRVADLNRIELPAGAYDCVVAHDALHHVLELEHLLDQVRHTLIPGGAVVVSDFVGAGRWEKLAWAIGYAALPTRMPFRTKWARRGRAKAFLASEEQKRAAAGEAGTALLHDTSPFEGISQASITSAVAQRFEVFESFTFCPLWYHLVPKLRVPRAARGALLRLFRPIDAALHGARITRGSYVFIEGRRR